MESIRYDIDNIGEVKESEVEVCQYLRPDGRKRKMAAPLGKEYHEKVKDLIITAEELVNGRVVIYIRHKDQDEEETKLEIFNNDESLNPLFKDFIDTFLQGS